MNMVMSYLLIKKLYKPEKNFLTQSKALIAFCRLWNFAATYDIVAAFENNRSAHQK